MPYSSPEEFLEEVIRIAQQDGKIYAIKFYREETGCGLAEAKEHLEALLEGGRPSARLPEPPPSAQDLPCREEIVMSLQKGRPIEAIRTYREATGRGLRESKLAIEEFARDRGIPIRTGAGRGLRILMLAALALVPAVIYYSC